MNVSNNFGRKKKRLRAMWTNSMSQRYLATFIINLLELSHEFVSILP